MIDNAKTYLPADYAAYLLARYAGKTEAEWADILDIDAFKFSSDRQIPFVLCSGKRYYALSEVFMIISNCDREQYVDQLVAESFDLKRARSLPSVKLAFDKRNPKAPAYVEVVITKRGRSGLHLTPDEARLFADHLVRQADLIGCQEYEESEFLDANQTSEDYVNALLINLGLADQDLVSMSSKEVA